MTMLFIDVLEEMKGYDQKGEGYRLTSSGRKRGTGILSFSSRVVFSLTYPLHRAMSRHTGLLRPLLSLAEHASTPRAGPSRHPIIRTPASRALSTTSRLLAVNTNVLPRDSNIPFNAVQLVSQTDNSLSEPQPLRRLLTTYDPSTHALILVSSDPPVVKLVDKAIEAARTREAEARESIRRRTAAEEKEVQVSWGSASGDIGHKIALAKSLLERGDRVKLLFAPRQGERKDKTTPEAKKGIVQDFEEALEEVGRRWKEDTVKGKMVTCFWEAEGSVKEVVKAKVIEGEVEKRREREEKKEARRKKDEERRLRGEERKKQGLADE